MFCSALRVTSSSPPFTDGVQLSGGGTARWYVSDKGCKRVEGVESGVCSVAWSNILGSLSEISAAFLQFKSWREVVTRPSGRGRVGLERLGSARGLKRDDGDEGMKKTMG